ncbi:MAG: tRNA dihydrouridine(20/20a) synthase DusA [Betaproteobacteria bacterium]
MPQTTPRSHRLCTAPMMDWSDRHCRFFFRQLSPHAMVYTEMVTTGALIHGDVERHLRFNPAEHPLALQIGGSEPADLARCATLGQAYGYNEINLNCGCPSERVQHGAFGACLMAEPQLVAGCVKAMQDAVAVPVTVKHRLGIDSIEGYDFVRRFVEIVAAAGCRTFFVHSRNAILKGLSPKDNRAVPPLKYDYVYQLKRDFPELEIVINGGVETLQAIGLHLQHVDGVMLGRAAYHDPHLLAAAEARLYGEPPPARVQVVQAMFDYACQEVARGTSLRAITRHMLGLYHGQPNARLWRRMLSDAGMLAANRPDLLLQAVHATESTQAEFAAVA